MKPYLCFLSLLLSQIIFANESSVQWFIQPLKIKHQVGKETMTELAIYHFPKFMYHTHPAIMHNYISRENKLDEFTLIEDKSKLSNVNVADLYGIEIVYDLAADDLLIDLSKVKKPEAENLSIDEVVEITLECVRLTGSSSRTTILTNEATTKWKSYEKGLRERSLKKPIYKMRELPLKVEKGELLYHWSFSDESISDEVEIYAQYPTYGGVSEGYDTCYQGNGFSRMLIVSDDGENEFFTETNGLAGYTFLKKGGVVSIQADVKSKQSQKSPLLLMQDAIRCLALSAKANGESREDYEIKLIDPRLIEAQKKELLDASSFLFLRQ
jgi:hypothetical protein